MTPTTRLTLMIALASLTLASSAVAQDAAAAPEAAAPAADASVEADVSAPAEAPAVESPAATEAAAQAAAPVAAPVPAPTYPVPTAEPAPDTNVVYAPPAGANAYPSPQQTLAAPRPAWPRPGKFGFLVAYAPSIAVGSSANFASNFGYRGFALGLRYMLNEIFSVGIESGWSYQDDKSRETGSVEGERRTVTVTSGQIRSTEVIPIVATAHYYYDAGQVIPHAGLALGTYYSRRDLNAGLFYLKDDGWHFGFSPEVGILVPLGSMQFLAAARFNYLVESAAMPEEIFFDFRIGILGF